MLVHSHTCSAESQTSTCSPPGFMSFEVPHGSFTGPLSLPDSHHRPSITDVLHLHRPDSKLTVYVTAVKSKMLFKHHSLFICRHHLCPSRKHQLINHLKKLLYGDFTWKEFNPFNPTWTCVTITWEVVLFEFRGRLKSNMKDSNIHSEQIFTVFQNITEIKCECFSFRSRWINIY